MNEDLVRQRAYVIFELTKEMLMEGGVEENYTEGFRFTYLILRGPRRFLETFGQGNLFLNYDLISDAYFMLRFDLQGPRGLMPYEEEIIFNHNKEVELLLEQAATCSY